MTHRIACILFLVAGLNVSLFSQKAGRSLVDSLYGSLQGLTYDSSRIGILGRISYEMRMIDPGKGLMPGLEALVLSIKFDDLYGKAFSHFALGLNYAQLSRQAEAIDHAVLAVSLFRKLNNADLLCASYLSLAGCYQSFDRDAMTINLIEAKKYFPLVRDPLWKLRNAGNIAIIYRSLFQLDSAIHYSSLQKKLAVEMKDSLEINLANRSIGVNYFRRNSFDSAWPYLQSTLSYFRKIGDLQIVSSTLNLLGQIRVGQYNEGGPGSKKYYREAIAYLEEGLEIAMKINLAAQCYYNNVMLGDLYFSEGECNKSILYLRESVFDFRRVWGIENVNKASMISLRNEQKLKDKELEVMHLRNVRQSGIIVASVSGVIVLVMIVLIIVRSRMRLRKAYTLVNEKKKEVSRVLADLGATNQELEAFSYSVSHDLRAPVRRIESLAGILKEEIGSSLSPENQDLLQRIEDSSVRMNLLIDDLLKLSKVTRQTLSRSDCDLSEMAGKITSELLQAYHSAGFRCSIEEGIRVSADPQLLQIALQNLLDNAFKYSSKTEHPEVILRTEVKDGRKFILVSDNGAGFDINKAGKLFTPFQRMHSEEEFKGTGIGLATVKRIVSRHGGTIGVESEPGKGTTFRFSLD